MVNWLVEAVAEMIETAATAVAVADSHLVGGEGEGPEIGGTVAATEKAQVVVEVQSTTATHPEALIRIATHHHHRATTLRTMAQHSSQP